MTPEWIQAHTSIGTLAAAIAAGYFAYRAAHWTKKQAKASKRQVAIAGGALIVAQGEAQVAREASEQQRVEADAAYRRFAESRLDTLAPVVFCVASPIGPWLEVGRPSERGQRTGYQEVAATSFEESQQEGLRFRTVLNIELRNVSDQIARIDIVGTANGEILPSAGEIFLAPGQTSVYRWVRYLTPAVLQAQADIDDPKKWCFNLSLWVRDLGQSVRDTYAFSGDLRLFGRDGTRLTVRTEPELVWTENVATPLGTRVYERLVPPTL